MLPATSEKKIKFYLPRRQSMFSLDEDLKRVTVKQKPFRQI